MKNFKNIILLTIVTCIIGCVDSSLYNTSIGEKANTKYPQSTSQSNITVSDSIKVKELVVFDTSFVKKTRIVSLPVNEAKKDSLLFTLVKDKTLSEEQKSNKIADFINSYKKEEIYYDTIINQKTIKDTILTNSELTEEEKLRKQLEALQIKASQLNNKNEQLKLYTPSELYNFGY